ARSGGSPQMPWPVIRIAPKPIRRTTRSPPSVIEPAAAAGSSVGITGPFGSAAGGALGSGEDGLCLLDAAPPEESQVLLLPPRGPDEEVLQLDPETFREREHVLRLVTVRRHRGEEQPIVPLPSGPLLPVLLHLQHAEQARRHDRAWLPRTGA